MKKGTELFNKSKPSIVWEYVGQIHGRHVLERGYWGFNGYKVVYLTLDNLKGFVKENPLVG